MMNVVSNIMTWFVILCVRAGYCHLTHFGELYKVEVDQARRFFLASTAAKFRCDSQKRFDNTDLVCVLVHLAYVLLL
jgi:hypothetical protein